MKWLAGLLATALLAACAWFDWGHLGLTAGPPDAHGPGVATLRNLLGQPTAPHPSAEPHAAGKPRKCLVQGDVLYTNGECPAGSRQRAIVGGSVSVLPAGPAATPASAAQGPKHVRDLLVKPDEVNIKDKRMEEIIGK